MSLEALLAGAVELLQPLRCGSHALSVAPSIAFCLGMGLLFYTVLRQGRPPLFRRISRDVLVQEVIFSWLINITLKGWLLFLDALDSLLLILYVAQMRAWFPPKWRSSEPDLSALPGPVQALLQPLTIKLITCSLVACVPFLLIWKIYKHNEHMRNVMMWHVHNRWERTELGFGRHFINRPPRVFDPPMPPARGPTLPTRRSTGCLDAVDVDVGRVHLGARHRRAPSPALRASKSLH